VESKTSHKQWQMDIDDLSKHCPEGFSYPSGFVFKLLKVPVSIS
jgi:hypothetical protein